MTIACGSESSGWVSESFYYYPIVENIIDIGTIMHHAIVTDLFQDEIHNYATVPGEFWRYYIEKRAFYLGVRMS